MKSSSYIGKENSCNGSEFFVPAFCLSAGDTRKREKTEKILKYE